MYPGEVQHPDTLKRKARVRRFFNGAHGLDNSLRGEGVQFVHW
jgi:hypothetical protein